jgi:opacity protein-like surface antigen
MEKTMRSQKMAMFLVGLLVISFVCFAQTPRQVRVTLDNASIRIKPAEDAEIIDIAAKGTVFDVFEKAGSWYAVVFGADQAGRPVYGYIHESMVSPVGEIEQKSRIEEKPKEPEPPAQPKAEKQVPQVQKGARYSQKVISGTSLKFGFGEDRWIASLALDLGVPRNFTLGVELQPYYKSYSEMSLSVAEMNIFANAKLGFRVGALSLYGGGGIGPNLSRASTTIDGESFSQFATRLAYHVLAGTAINIGAIALVFEYQMIVVSDPEVNPNTWTYFFLFGLKF